MSSLSFSSFTSVSLGLLLLSVRSAPLLFLLCPFTLFPSPYLSHMVYKGLPDPQCAGNVLYCFFVSGKNDKTIFPLNCICLSINFGMCGHNMHTHVLKMFMCRVCLHLCLQGLCCFAFVKELTNCLTGDFSLYLYDTPLHLHVWQLAPGICCEGPSLCLWRELIRCGCVCPILGWSLLRQHHLCISFFTPALSLHSLCITPCPPSTL